MITNALASPTPAVATTSPAFTITPTTSWQWRLRAVDNPVSLCLRRAGQASLVGPETILMMLPPHSGLCHLSFGSLFLFFFSLFKDPPIVQDFKPLVDVTETTHNRFSIQIDPRLLNDTNGPVTHVGVLVTNESPGRFPPTTTTPT